VTYVNALATLSSPNSVSYNLAGKNGGEKTVSAQYIVIAVGGRPYIPSNVSGALEYAITSDDIFYLEKSPGKTLCVGGSYISLECAGFLAELGYDVTVSARSILLRGFDRQCAEKVGEVMFNNGVKFLMGTSPSSITKLADGRLQVVLEDSRGAESLQTFDTVLFATGRQPDVSQLNLAGVGINFIPETGKIPVVNEQTNVPSIFAIGDVCEGKQELTPVAIKAGELLAKRLFGGSRELMDYNTVATTVFTPSEYGSVGLSEEEAVQMYGEADVEVYLSEFTTLEYSAVHRMKHKMHGDDEDFGHNCLSKLVCIRSQEEKVVGFHFVGPNAGEITQV
jgi:thioredoxin reductase (NADPH)